MSNSLWSQVKPAIIPEISDADLEEMIGVIKPVRKTEGRNRFREIVTDGVDRRCEAFTWKPRLGRPVRIYRGTLNEVNLMTFHTWAYYGFFKPTLAEAYACIRVFVPDWRKARFFWLNSEGMDHRNIVGDYHWCPCVLFGPEETNVIDSEWDSFVEHCKTNTSEED